MKRRNNKAVSIKYLAYPKSCPPPSPTPSGKLTAIRQFSYCKGYITAKGA